MEAHADGSAIYLRDVARVELGQSNYNFFGEVDGKPAVNVGLYLLSDAAVNKVAKLIARDPAIESVTAISGYSILTGAMVSNGGTLFVVEGNQTRALASVFSTYRANVPQYFIDVDRVKAKNLGVPLNEIFATLQAQMGSLYINDFNKFGQIYRVIMQAESSYRSDLSDLDRFYMQSSSGEMVPLSTLVTTRPILGHWHRPAPVLGERGHFSTQRYAFG